MGGYCRRESDAGKIRNREGMQRGGRSRTHLATPPHPDFAHPPSTLPDPRPPRPPQTGRDTPPGAPLINACSGWSCTLRYEDLNRGFTRNYTPRAIYSRSQ